MNRTLCIILSLLLALSVFTACADTNTPASGDTLATGDSVVSEDTLPNEPEITTTKTYDISRYEKSSEFLAVIYNDVPYYYSENIYDPQELAYYLSQAEYVGQVESDADENYAPAEDYSDGETPVGEMFPTKNFQSNFLAIGTKLHILDGYMIAEFAEPWDNGKIVYGQVLMLPETAEEPIIEAEDDEPLTPPTNTVYDGYPSLDDENYSETFDKWYNDKCEIVAAALDEVAFIYGKIIELNESDNGYVKIMIRPNDDNPPNYRDNAYFSVSESTLIRSGYWPGAAEMAVDSLMVGQKVCVAVCHVPDIPEVSPTALYAFAVILLDGNPANPDSLTDEDFKYVDTDEGIIVEEAEIEIEVEVEEEPALTTDPGAEEISLDSEPVYFDVEIIDNTDGTGVPMSYEELAKEYLGIYENLRFIEYEITKVYTPNEAYSIKKTRSYREHVALYQVHITYDHITDCELDEYVYMSHSGNSIKQFEGMPAFAVGDRFISAVVGNLEDRIVPIDLEYAIYEIDGVEYAYLIGNDRVAPKSDDLDLDLPMSASEKLVITTTVGNPARYTQKSTLESVIKFIREDWLKRGIGLPFPKSPDVTLPWKISKPAVEYWANMDNRISFDLCGVAAPNSASFSMLNGNEKLITTGNSFIIEIFKDGKWHYVDIGIKVFPAEAIVLESGQSYDFHIDWTNYYGELVPGKYRLIKEYSVEGSSEIYYAICEFMIRE